MDSEAGVADDDAVRPIGAILAAARAERGLELAEVARDTRVPVRHLAAIEADIHDDLPALPYTIGFVKAFARAVGVDADMAAARFRAETSKPAHVPQATAMTPLDERRLPPRGLVVLSIVLLIAAVAAIVAWSAGAFDRAPPAEVAVTPKAAPAASPAAEPTVPAATVAAGPDTAPAATTAPVAVPTTPSANTPAAPAAPAATGSAAAGSVAITASDDAWFKVSAYDAAAGKVVTVKTGVLAKGERYVPPPTPGLRLWTGRAGALHITVDGRAIPPLGGPVETVKNISLDPADLRARLAAQPVPAPGRAGPPVG